MSQRFHIYGYQILPIAQRQLRLFDEPISLDALKDRKNELFLEALATMRWEYRQHEVSHRILYRDSQLIILQVALNRGRVKVNKPDFTEDVYQDWPSFIIGFNNDPNVQRAVIEIEYKAFRKTITAIEMVQQNLNATLERYSLHVAFNPVFEANDFWDLIRRYPTVYQVEFELVAPNLVNISGAIEDSIKDWFPATNAQTIDIEMESDQNSSLDLQRGSEPVTSFVNYASRGGGNISIKAREIRRRISTKDSVSEITIQDLDIRSDIENNVDSIVRELSGLRIE